MEILKLIFGINIIFIIYFAKKNIKKLFQNYNILFITLYIFYRKLNPGKTLTIFFINYMLQSVGMFLLHRYFAHKQFEFKETIDEIIAWLISANTLLESPFTLANWHRHHHEYNTDDDLHSPWINGKITLNSFLNAHNPYNWSKKIQDNTKLKNNISDLRSNKYFVLLENNLNQKHFITFSILINYIFGNLNGVLSYFAALSFQFNCLFLINSYLHAFGYSNFEAGTSKNSFLLFPFLLGDHLHNNHHNKCHLRNNNRVKWYEIDQGYLVLLVLKN